MSSMSQIGQLQIPNNRKPFCRIKRRTNQSCMAEPTLFCDGSCTISPYGWVRLHDENEICSKICVGANFQAQNERGSHHTTTLESKLRRWKNMPCQSTTFPCPPVVWLLDHYVTMWMSPSTLMKHSMAESILFCHGGCTISPPPWNFRSPVPGVQQLIQSKYCKTFALSTSKVCGAPRERWSLKFACFGTLANQIRESTFVSRLDGNSWETHQQHLLKKHGRMKNAHHHDCH